MCPGRCSEAPVQQCTTVPPDQRQQHELGRQKKDETTYLQAPGRLTAEMITPGATSMVRGETRASSSSSSTLRAPSARQGDTPAGQEVSRELGSLTWMTMLWSTSSLSVATTDSPVMYVMSGTSEIGAETAPSVVEHDEVGGEGRGA